MKSLFFKGLAGVAATGTVAAGGFFVLQNVNKPVDVKSRLIWEGYTVADVSKDGVWRAIYLARHNLEGFSSFASGSSKSEAGPSIKRECSSLLSVSASDSKYEDSYEKAKKWCLRPELTTIEMQFDFEDREFASGDDDFKNLFTLNKGSEDFVNSIKTSASDFSNTTPLDTAHGKVKTWCESLKVKAPHGDDLKRAKAWCTRPDATLSGFMDKQGFKTVPEGGWAAKFSSLKSEGKDSSLDTDIGTTQDNGGADKLKQWCNGKNLNTAKIHSLGDDLGKLKSRCFVSK
ncbi:hypothetical protein MHC_03865 [Mycoplasma haemocanis str. Illinois]|uniref:Uncharacterized protein n=1 Tax=Mycoplasma haemocanis (strain Illinois) TaxID=1111676 RepID=H6N7L1_MYCHN|nr:hypothetical protein [Mycoplasma haemocanis]AEW45633.1 hypothetical protein MHC_03865 [Mycoplasma haemocanis str. Illinois]